MNFLWSKRLNYTLTVTEKLWLWWSSDVKHTAASESCKNSRNTTEVFLLLLCFTQHPLWFVCRPARRDGFPASTAQTGVNSESAGAYFQWWSRVIHIRWSVGYLKHMGLTQYKPQQPCSSWGRSMSHSATVGSTGVFLIVRMRLSGLQDWAKSGFRFTWCSFISFFPAGSGRLGENYGDHGHSENPELKFKGECWNFKDGDKSITSRGETFFFYTLLWVTVKKGFRVSELIQVCSSTVCLHASIDQCWLYGWGRWN